MPQERCVNMFEKIDNYMSQHPKLTLIVTALTIYIGMFIVLIANYTR